MAERHRDLAFAGGALVFPGGKVAAVDQELDPDRWEGPALATWCSGLSVSDPTLALGLVVAAVRETFEETGLLLAKREDGSPLVAEDLRRPSVVDARRRLNDRHRPWDWRPWLVDEGFVLDFHALAFWSWWITPSRSPNRYDTRFFVAHVPEDQVAYHDDVEIIGTRWWRPEEALQARRRRTVRLMYPTRCNLHELVEYPDADAAVAAAHRRDVDRCRLWPRE